MQHAFVCKYPTEKEEQDGYGDSFIQPIFIPWCTLGNTAAFTLQTSS